jgi:hypothetical protein
LSGDKSVSLPQYYRSFKGIYGAMAGVFGTIPLWSKLVSTVSKGYAAYIFPPVGILEDPARIAIVLLALAANFVAYFAQSASLEGDRKRIITASAIAALFVFVYLGLFFRFARTVDIPTRNTSVLVSVGYQRTDFAKTNFDGKSDWDLLRERGTDEEEIWNLWTTKSLLISRLSLCFAYAIVILSFVMAFSWGATHHLKMSKS